MLLFSSYFNCKLPFNQGIEIVLLVVYRALYIAGEAMQKEPPQLMKTSSAFILQHCRGGQLWMPRCSPSVTRQLTVEKALSWSY